MPALKIHIDPVLCIGCGQCSQVCVAHNIEIKDGHAFSAIGDETRQLIL